MNLPTWFAIAGVLVWAGYEILLRRRADADAADWHGGESDRRSTPLLILSYVLAVVLVIVLGSAGIGTLPVAVQWIGVAVVVCGLALRAWGMATLGRFYTRTLRVTDDQRVVQDGPYRAVRHPGYAGSLLVWAGYCLGVGNWIAFIVVTALMVLAYSYRIRSEERMLTDTFGDAYREYQQHTARLIPFVF
ncbi:methyltransferase family protein [Actinomadura gamaensis]|uniref:Methyltransferase family protein n=1 Tax=Actinomadura gamaensis TaxID=1763541 RepID=A0ABV9U1K6_9ACTN